MMVPWNAVFVGASWSWNWQVVAVGKVAVPLAPELSRPGPAGQLVPVIAMLCWAVSVLVNVTEPPGTTQTVLGDAPAAAMDTVTAEAQLVPPPPEPLVPPQAPSSVAVRIDVK